MFEGLDGNYRAYYWSNGQAVDFDQSIAKHTGWGINLDQRIADGYTLFARFGQQTKGQVQFDQTLTGGVEIGGGYWGRAADALGVAAGSQRTSSEFRNNSATVDGDGDGQADFGYQAQGSERILEVYYRFHLHKQFELSPDIQYIRHPGGNPDQPSMTSVGLRAQVNF